MIIIGNRYIQSETFVFIDSVDKIKDTPSNSTLTFSYDLEIMEYCALNQLPYTLFISNITEAIFGNNLGAKYLIVDEKYSYEIQKIAEYYMFDSKILVPIEDDSMIEKIAKNGIDGIIYTKFLEGLRQ